MNQHAGLVLSSPQEDSARKFDLTRAGEYESQCRIALAGYDACHELAACMLAAALGSGGVAQILVGGGGGGAKEIVSIGTLEPSWRFTAVDPSQPMLDLTIERLKQTGLMQRAEVHLGYVDDLPLDPRFDAATLIGVLHHLRGQDAKRAILQSIAARLKPGAPLILACNRFVYTSQPLLLAAWGERWRMQGAGPEERAEMHGKILRGADPPGSEEAVLKLLAEAGFEQPISFFSSLFWGAWMARRGS